MLKWEKVKPGHYISGDYSIERDGDGTYQVLVGDTTLGFVARLQSAFDLASIHHLSNLKG